MLRLAAELSRRGRKNGPWRRFTHYEACVALAIERDALAAVGEATERVMRVSNGVILPAC
jgi:hypothetical protein